MHFFCHVFFLVEWHDPRQVPPRKFDFLPYPKITNSNVGLDSSSHPNSKNICMFGGKKIIAAGMVEKPGRFWAKTVKIDDIMFF